MNKLSIVLILSGRAEMGKWREVCTEAEVLSWYDEDGELDEYGEDVLMMLKDGDDGEVFVGNMDHVDYVIGCGEGVELKDKMKEAMKKKWDEEYGEELGSKVSGWIDQTWGATESVMLV